MPVQEAPTTRLSSPLWKGTAYSKGTEGYDLSFGDAIGPTKPQIKEANLSTLVVAVAKSPAINSRLTLTRKDTETSEAYKDGDTTVNNRIEEIYEAKYDGIFRIPWIVNVRVMNGEVVVNYIASLTRPDHSLTYLLEQSKKPEFLAALHYGHQNQKIRTRIDGLLVWIGIDEWEKVKSGQPQAFPIEKDEPKRMVLYHKGLKPQQFLRRDGATAQLQHADRFIGSWHERWFWIEENGQKALSSMEVKLVGHWDR